MNMNPFPDLAADTDAVPVTVLLSPAQVARLECLIAASRARNPSIDDDIVVDAVFAAGLQMLETTPSAEEVDAHLDKVLRAAGSALRHYSMPQTLQAMRAAMRAAMQSYPRHSQETA